MAQVVFCPERDLAHKDVYLTFRICMSLYFITGCLNDCECKEPNKNQCIGKKCQCNDGFFKRLLDDSCVGMLNPQYQMCTFKKSLKSEIHVDIVQIIH